MRTPRVHHSTVSIYWITVCQWPSALIELLCSVVLEWSTGFHKHGYVQGLSSIAGCLLQCLFQNSGLRLSTYVHMYPRLYIYTFSMSSLTLCFTVTVAVSGYEKVVTDRHAYIQAQLGPRSHQHLPCLHHHAPHAKTFGSTVKSALWTPQKTGHLWCCGHFILSRMLLLYKIYSIIWTLFYHFRKIVCHIRWI